METAQSQWLPCSRRHPAAPVLRLPWIQGSIPFEPAWRSQPGKGQPGLRVELCDQSWNKTEDVQITTSRTVGIEGFLKNYNQMIFLESQKTKWVLKMSQRQPCWDLIHFLLLGWSQMLALGTNTSVLRSPWLASCSSWLYCSLISSSLSALASDRCCPAERRSIGSATCKKILARLAPLYYLQPMLIKLR